VLSGNSVLSTRRCWLCGYVNSLNEPTISICRPFPRFRIVWSVQNCVPCHGRCWTRRYHKN
jgi:hypothetical protein